MARLQTAFLFTDDELAVLLGGLCRRQDLYRLLLGESTPDWQAGAGSLVRKGLLAGDTVEPVTAYLFRAMNTARIRQQETFVLLHCDKLDIRLDRYPHAEQTWRLTPVQKEKERDGESTS